MAKATEPPVSHPLSDELAELVARRFRILGEPMRIRLLERLQLEPSTVNQLAEDLDTSQQNVSKHLGVLHAAGIVEREKEGVFVRYSIADPSVFELCDLVCGGLRRQAGEMSALLDATEPSA